MGPKAYLSFPVSTNHPISLAMLTCTCHCTNAMSVVKLMSDTSLASMRRSSPSHLYVTRNLS